MSSYKRCVEQSLKKIHVYLQICMYPFCKFITLYLNAYICSSRLGSTVKVQQRKPVKCKGFCIGGHVLMFWAMKIAQHFFFKCV